MYQHASLFAARPGPVGPAGGRAGPVGSRTPKCDRHHAPGREPLTRRPPPRRGEREVTGVSRADFWRGGCLGSRPSRPALVRQPAPFASTANSFVGELDGASAFRKGGQAPLGYLGRTLEREIAITRPAGKDRHAVAGRKFFGLLKSTSSPLKLV